LITDARLAEEQTTRFAHDVVIARDRLRMLLGVANSEPSKDGRIAASSERQSNFNMR
jgi:hypothetical protein